MLKKSVVVVQHQFYDHENEGESYTVTWGVFDTYEHWKAVEKEVKHVSVNFNQYQDDYDECMGYLKNGLQRVENEYAKAWFQDQIESMKDKDEEDFENLSKKFCSLCDHEQGHDRFYANTIYYLTTKDGNDDQEESTKKRQRVE